jgi:colicin import membrane protein
MLLRSVIYSILIHVLAAGLLVVSFDFPVEAIKPPAPRADIVTAVTVDEQQVEKELQRLKEKEAAERRREQQRQEEMEQKLKQAEQQRRAEEKRLAELKQQQQKEAQQRQAEQQRLAELKQKQQEAEQQRRLEEKRKAEAEAERKRIEEARKKAEEEKRRAEQEKQRLEEERKRREAEEALKRQLAEEQKVLEAAQAREDQRVIDTYGRRIQDAIRRQFNITGLPEGLSCTLQIRTIPGGDVVSVRVVSSSGNPIFDRRAETAVNKASPLPVPDNMRIFEKMREINIEFAPKG